MSSSDEQKHINKIKNALSQNNVKELRRLSRKGFVNNELRKKVWPILLGCGSADDGDDEHKNNLNDNEHDYVDQIKKDAVRSMHHFDVTKKYSLDERKHEQEVLERILHGIFVDNRDLHYTQGFHDMCSVFYIVCGENLGRVLSENLIKRHMRDAVRDNMSVFQFILKLLFPLLSLIDTDLYKLLSAANLSSIFALSWILTWFAHNIEKFDDITRLYDYFLASHPLMPLYFSVALIKMCKNQLFKINENSDLDQGRLHQFFQEFHWNIDYDLIINDSYEIFKKYPPELLYRQSFLEDLKDIPKDSPFLARNISEVENMKTKYSLSDLSSVWHFQNPKFWRYIALPIITSIVIFHIANSHLNK